MEILEKITSYIRTDPLLYQLIPISSNCNRQIMKYFTNSYVFVIFTDYIIVNSWSQKISGISREFARFTRRPSSG